MINLSQLSLNVIQMFWSEIDSSMLARIIKQSMKNDELA